MPSELQNFNKSLRFSPYLSSKVLLLISKRFEGVTEENKDLAQLLQKYYSESYALSIGEMITKQSQNAPRNIYLLNVLLIYFYILQ